MAYNTYLVIHINFISFQVVIGDQYSFAVEHKENRQKDEDEANKNKRTMNKKTMRFN